LCGCETWLLALKDIVNGSLRMFENRAQRKTFGVIKKEVTRELRKQHNEELRALYRSANILRMVKSIRMRLGDLTEKEHLEKLRVDGRIIFKFIFKK
jgi:hypothetical protein